MKATPAVPAVVLRKDVGSAHAALRASQATLSPRVALSDAHTGTGPRAQSKAMAPRASVPDRASADSRADIARSPSSIAIQRDGDGTTRESVSKPSPAVVPAPAPTAAEETKLVTLAPISSGESDNPRDALPTEQGNAPANPAAGASPRRESTRPHPAPREGILTSLLNLAKRGGKAAPIEERTAVATTRVASLSAETRRSVERPAAAASSEIVAERASPPPAAVSADVITRPISPALSPGFANAAVGPGMGAPSTAPSYGEKLETAPEESVAPTRADVAEQGRRAVADVVSRTAAQTEVEIGRVLARAGTSYRLEEQQWIVDAARRSFGRNAIPVAATAVSDSAATPLKDEARRAFFAQRDPDRALDLYVQAFGADPYDAETAGNLASLYLRVRPWQAHAARQLAMHAIAVASAQSRAPRVQDWSTFAVASALIGRDDDATHALFVAAALTANLPSTCKTALSAVAIYGDRMRVPVESMLLRMHAQGRDRESPYCSFPPKWSSTGRFY